MASKVRVAFVGTGGIANNHMTSVHGFKDCEIVGLCDVNPERLKEKQEKFGGQTFIRVEEMLAATKPDAVYICLPPFAHGLPEMVVFKAKVPFFVEKPQTIDLALAKRISSTASKAKLITAVGYQNRYRKGVQLAKKTAQTLPVSLACGWWIGGTPRNHPWLGIKKMSGGQMLEQTTHTFDLLRYICGEAVSVFCQAAKGFIKDVPRYKTDDATTAVVRMKSGAVANIMSSWSSGCGGGVELHLYGPDVKIDLMGWDHGLKMKTTKKEGEIEIPGEGNIFEVEDRAFMDAVKKKDQSKVLCDYEDGLRSLALSIAANQSLESGEVVKVR